MKLLTILYLKEIKKKQKEKQTNMLWKKRKWMKSPRKSVFSNRNLYYLDGASGGSVQ